MEGTCICSNFISVATNVAGTIHQYPDMNDFVFFKGLVFVCAIILVTCIFLKFFYFIKAGKTGPLEFTASFLKETICTRLLMRRT